MRRDLASTAQAGTRALTLAAALLTLAAASSAGACERSTTSSGGAIKWWTNCIPYHLHDAGSEDVALSAALDAVQRSFATWEGPSCVDLSLEYQGLTNDPRVGYIVGGTNINNVVWRERAADWPHQDDVIAVTTVTFCDRAGGACPFAGAIIDADIELNGAGFTFTTSTLPGRIAFDIRNTVTHEAGHFLGLDHTKVTAATMFASAPRGELDKTTLHEDDIECLCAIYPVGGTACGPIEVQGDYFVDLNDLGSSERSAGSDCTSAPGRSGSAPLGLLLFALCGLVLPRLFRGRGRVQGRWQSPKLKSVPRMGVSSQPQPAGQSPASTQPWVQ